MAICDASQLMAVAQVGCSTGACLHDVAAAGGGRQSDSCEACRALLGSLFVRFLLWATCQVRSSALADSDRIIASLLEHPAAIRISSQFPLHSAQLVIAAQQRPKALHLTRCRLRHL